MFNKTNTLSTDNDYLINKLLVRFIKKIEVQNFDFFRVYFNIL